VTPEEDRGGVLCAVVPDETSDGSTIKLLMPRYSGSMSEDGPEDADRAPEPPIGQARRRAPKRADGRRVQLTVPEDMWGELGKLAAQVGTTPNDVLVQLAAEQLRARRRRRELEARAERRRQAFRDATPPPQAPAEPLSESELVALALAMREEA